MCILESPLLFGRSRTSFATLRSPSSPTLTSEAKRVKRREGLTIDQFQQRVDAQINDETRRRLADIVIENNGSLEDLRRAVNRIKI